MLENIGLENRIHIATNILTRQIQLIAHENIQKSITAEAWDEG